MRIYHGRVVKRWVLLLFCGLLSIILIHTARADFYGDAATKRYHADDCTLRPQIKPRNLTTFTSESQASARGYYPCGVCIPPLGREYAGVTEHRNLSTEVHRGAVYIVDQAKQIFHYQWCPVVTTLDPKQTTRLTQLDKTVVAGLRPCSNCNPPVPLTRNWDIQANTAVAAGELVRTKTSRPIDLEKAPIPNPDKPGIEDEEAAAQ